MLGAPKRGWESMLRLEQGFEAPPKRKREEEADVPGVPLNRHPAFFGPAPQEAAIAEPAREPLREAFKPIRSRLPPGWAMNIEKKPQRAVRSIALF